MIYGYLRVSTDEQDINSQRQGVDDFAKNHGWTIDEYISDEGVSGGKDPSKRKLGAVLEGLKKGDIIIASEISRLGRDLYMVMDILHHCMKTECVIYTVKDKFVLGNDIQSKVLAFAFGLSAEIERQMIQQRTREGLRLRMKMGVLIGRPLGKRTREELAPYTEEMKTQIIEQFKWGVPSRRLAKNFGVTRAAIDRWLHVWGVHHMDYIDRAEEKARKERQRWYKENDYKVIELTNKEHKKLKGLIELDLTLPEIAATMPQYTYEQIYDTVLVDEELNPLYRQHGQLKVKKVRQ